MERTFKPIRTGSALLASFTAVALALSPTGLRAGDQGSLRASYVENLSKFVEWPEQAFKDDSEHLDICVQGEEILNTLTAELKDHRIGKRTIAITPLSRHPKGQGCEELLISADEAWRMKTILAEIGDRPILTISNSDGFAKSGGMIELVKVDERLGFEINQTVAEKAGLKISSQVLKLAKAVYR